MTKTLVLIFKFRLTFVRFLKIYFLVTVSGLPTKFGTNLIGSPQSNTNGYIDLNSHRIIN